MVMTPRTGTLGGVRGGSPPVRGPLTPRPGPGRPGADPPPRAPAPAPARPRPGPPRGGGDPPPPRPWEGSGTPKNGIFRAFSAYIYKYRPPGTPKKPVFRAFFVKIDPHKEGGTPPSPGPSRGLAGAPRAGASRGAPSGPPRPGPVPGPVPRPEKAGFAYKPYCLGGSPGGQKTRSGNFRPYAFISPKSRNFGGQNS